MAYSHTHSPKHKKKLIHSTARQPVATLHLLTPKKRLRHVAPLASLSMQFVIRQVGNDLSLPRCPRKMSPPRAHREKPYQLITYVGKTSALRRITARIKLIRGRIRDSYVRARDACKKSLVGTYLPATIKLETSIVLLV